MPPYFSIYLLIFLCLFPCVSFANSGADMSELTGEQRDYYIRSFNDAMETSKANDIYSWKTLGAEGKIRASEKYVSKSESICRNYIENFTSGGKTATNQGITCKRSGDSGWCKLKEGDAHTCALETPQSSFDKSFSKAKSWFGF